MTDFQFVEQLLTDWLDDADHEYACSSSRDPLRLGELMGRVEALHSFRDYIRTLRGFGRKDIEEMKKSALSVA